MKDTKNSHIMTEPLPFPWHIHIDKKADTKGRKSGRLIHVEKPKFECKYTIRAEQKTFKGLSIYNIKTGVQLYDLVLPDGQELNAKNLSYINNWMKEGARALYDLLYMPYFRK